MKHFTLYPGNDTLHETIFRLILWLHILIAGPGIAKVQAQTFAQGCRVSQIAEVAFTVNALVYVDPDTGGSRASVGEVEIWRSGEYRFLTKVNYNSGDVQRNESFFLIIITAGNDTIAPVDANAGPYKVVRDITGPVQHVWQDAGRFRLPAGTSEIAMHHYAKIAAHYPAFLYGPIDGEESVYVDSIRIVYDPIVDGEVKLRAFTEDSVIVANQRYGLLMPGDAATYKIIVGNTQQDSLYNATMTAVLADSLAAAGFSVPPDSMNDNTFFWNLPPIAGGDSLVLSFHAELAGSMPAGFTLLPVTVALNTPCDLDLSNNFASLDIYAYADSNKVEPNFTDIAARISTNIDSLQVSDGGDTLYFAQSDSSVVYKIRLRNLGPDSAKDMRVENFFSHPVLRDSFSISPVETQADTLKWSWPELAPGATIVLSYRAKMPEVNAGENFNLTNTVRVFAGNDTATANNFDNFIVIVHKAERDHTDKEVHLADIAVRQISVTDSFLVQGRDTLLFVRAGETYRRTLVVANESDTVASNIVLQSFYSSFAKPHSFSREPEMQNTTVLTWEMPSLQPGESVRIGYDETLLSDLSPDLKIIVSEVRVAAENEDSLRLANNVTTDTLHVYKKIVETPIAVQPGIEASPAIVDIRQSISLRVRFLKEPATWDIWAYFADGRIDSTFADQQIALQPKPEFDAWLHLPEIFTDTRLYTDARRERIKFEIRVVDRDGLFAKNTAEVVVQSQNIFLLNRNVFEPDLHELDIRFKLDSNRNARLDVYNLAGQHITTLVEQPYEAGWHYQKWDGRTAVGDRVVSGVYLITIRSGDFNAWKRCILVR